MPVTVVTSENPAGEIFPSSGSAAPAPVVAASPDAEPTKAAPALSVQPENEPAPTTDAGKDNRIEQRFSTMQRHINEAKAEAAREKDARIALEIRLARGEPAPAKPAPQTAEAGPVSGNLKPDPSKYTDVHVYNADVALWAAREVSTENARVSAANAAVDSYAKRLAVAKAAHPDFDAVVQASSDVELHNEVRDAIFESEIGPELVYHFATNLDDAARLYKLSPRRALIELGKIEASLSPAAAGTAAPTSSAPAPAVVKTSKAPPPIAPLRGTGESADIPVDANGNFTGTFRQYAALRDAGKIH